MRARTQCTCACVLFPWALLHFNILQVDEAWRGDFLTHSASTVNSTPLPAWPGSDLKPFDVEMNAGKYGPKKGARGSEGLKRLN